MKIVILGSNSFLAQYLIREILNHDMEPVLYGVETQPEFRDLPFFPFKLPEIQLDLREITESDVIIYTAGAGIQTDLKEPADLLYELNSFFPVKLFNHLASAKFKGKIITFGSYFEIGDEPEKRYYTEEEVATSSKKITTHYPSSKRILTRYLTSSPLLPDFFHFILPNLYGKGENPNRLIPYIIQGIKSGTEIRLTAGTQVRQYIHAADVARAVMAWVMKSPSPGLYNLCNKEPVEIRALAGTIYKILNKEADFHNLNFGLNQRADTVMPFLLLDDEKTRRVMDFQPAISLIEGIKSYL
jgi:nucleoside-diphosphate-sugar epimerase